MKTTAKFFFNQRSIIFGLLVLLFQVSLKAQSSATWTGESASNLSWHNADNWGGTMPIWGTDLDVIFYAPNAQKLINMLGSSSGQHKTIGTLTFNGNVTSDLEIHLRRSASSALQLWGVREITVESGATANIAIAFGGPTTGFIRLDNPVLQINHDGTGKLSLARMRNQSKDDVRGISKSGNGTVHFTGHDNSFQSLTIRSGQLVLDETYSFNKDDSGALSTIGFGVTNGASGCLVVNSPAFSFDGNLHLNIASVDADSTNWKLFKGSEFNAETLGNLTGITSDIAGLTFSKKEDGTWEGTYDDVRWEFESATGKLRVFDLLYTALDNLTFNTQVFSKNGRLNLHINTSLIDARVNIFTVDGNKVYSQSIHTPNFTIEQKLYPGIYLVEIQNNANIATHKVIVK